MEVRLTSIAGRGELADERLGFVVVSSCELKYFILYVSKKTENGFSNRSKNAYWFLPQKLKPEDKVVLYTKKGENSVKKNDAGGTTYFYYWGLNSPLFVDQEVEAILVDVRTYKRFS